MTIRCLRTVAVGAMIAGCALPSIAYAEISVDSPIAAVERPSAFDMPSVAPIEFARFDLDEKLRGANLDPTFGIQIGHVLPSTGTAEVAVPSPDEEHLAKRGHLSAEVRPTEVPLPDVGRRRQSLARVNFNTPTLPPMAFVRFCHRYGGECDPQRKASRPVEVLTKEHRTELMKVNREVNRAIRPEENMDGVLREEWLVGPEAGDCNDYAVTKRHKLLALGWPSEALLLTEAVVPSGEHHLVLVVHTRDEDLVLDNLHWDVLPIAKLPYQWVRAQKPENPRYWAEISLTSRVAMNLHDAIR